MMKYFLVAALFLTALAGGYALSRPKPCGATCGEKISLVNPTTFAQKAKDPEVVLLDVRTSEEFAQGHLAGSVNIDFNNRSQFDAYLETLDKTKHYLVYCRSGNRSASAAKIMQNMGFKQITDLDGGINSWQAAGLPIE